MCHIGIESLPLGSLMCCCSQELRDIKAVFLLSLRRHEKGF